MTDYTEPVEAFTVCERISALIHVQATALREKATMLLARADELDEARYMIEDEAGSYARWQPQMTVAQEGRDLDAEIATALEARTEIKEALRGNPAD